MPDAYIDDPDLTVYVGDTREVLSTFADGSIECVVTSPPYLDARPEVPALSAEDWPPIFRELRRIVTGTALFNVGRVFRDGSEVLWWLVLVESARAVGWKLLDTRVWIKPNGNPIRGQVFADRHEYVLIFGEDVSALNVDAIRVPYAASSAARLKRGWTNHTGVKNDSGRQRGRRHSEPHPLGARAPSYIAVHTGGEKGNLHPTPMPLELAEDLVRLASWPGQIVLDPFAGSGTTLLAAHKHDRRGIGIELSPEYADLLRARTSQLPLLAPPC